MHDTCLWRFAISADGGQSNFRSAAWQCVSWRPRAVLSVPTVMVACRRACLARAGAQQGATQKGGNQPQ